MWFEKIRRYYEAGAWNRTMVANAVRKGKLTPDQYTQIVGRPL